MDEAPFEPPAASAPAVARSATGARDVRLAYLVAAFVALVGASQIGAIFFPTLIERSPEALLALSSRIRHLLFAVPAGVNPVAYALIGFLRLSIAAWICFALGYFYGDRGVAWLERQVPGETPTTFRWLQRAADRAGPLLVFFMPGSNVVGVLVGQRRMVPRRFGMWLSLGIAFRLGWLWIAARLFDRQLRTILGYIEKYQWWLVAAFFAVSMLQGARQASKNPPRPPTP